MVNPELKAFLSEPHSYEETQAYLKRFSLSRTAKKHLLNLAFTKHNQVAFICIFADLCMGHPQVGDDEQEVIKYYYALIKERKLPEDITKHAVLTKPISRNDDNEEFRHFMYILKGSCESEDEEEEEEDEML
jgi:hypothetical protein